MDPLAECQMNSSRAGANLAPEHEEKPPASDMKDQEQDRQRLWIATTERRYLEALIDEASQQLALRDSFIQEQEESLHQKHCRQSTDSDLPELCDHVLSASEFLSATFDAVVRRCQTLTCESVTPMTTPTQTVDDPLPAELEACLQQNALLADRCEEQADLLREQTELMHRLHSQLSRSATENERVQRQLRLVNALFEQLQRQEAEGEAALEASRRAESSAAEPSEPGVPDADQPNGLVERVDTPHGRRLVIHVSKTYLRLRDLILEKRALLSEIDKLKGFNVQLERRLNRQEQRLSSVAAELHSTWGLVTKLKIQHAQLHTTESVLRYELREKRRLLNRRLNAESELEWRALRRELDQRKRELVRQPHVEEEEPPVQASDVERDGVAGEHTIGSVSPEPEHEDTPDSSELPESPGSVDSSELPDTAETRDSSEPRPAGRLRTLEHQCQELYTRLVSTTARQVALSSRLAELHTLHGTSETASLASTSTDTAYASSEPQQTPSEAEADELPSDADEPNESASDSVDEAAPDETDEADGSRSDDVSTVGCKLISLLPSRMVHLRREREQLAQRIAELQRQNERIEQKLARMRTERSEHRRRGREDSTAKRHLEQRVQELELRVQQEQALRMQVRSDE
ncbi:uncharacterized protein LOC119102147 [Pollicipes pollicipes]|uniref:uncharacterized protein LOC119102147 n=1 Tax=Pollicipes pollicipes TaxID=41117 RepID=UPI00188576D7|nr:uncharacterized protein LOC119102147 [Pollicipes pollicipes]